MGKQYQTSAAEASTLGLTISAEVSVALGEIAESATEGLLALAVGAGLQVLGTMMEESVTQLAGRRHGERPPPGARSCASRPPGSSPATPSPSTLSGCGGCTCCSSSNWTLDEFTWPG
jgi:hypothetical protein